MDREVWILYQDSLVVDDELAVEIATKMVAAGCEFVHLDREHLGVICSKDYLTESRRRKIRARVILITDYLTSADTESIQKCDALREDTQNVNSNREDQS